MADASFVDYIRDQLRDVHGVGFRRMFGGTGLYADGMFFGLIIDTQLYFKTDEASRQPYIARGMGPFNYHTKKGTKTLKNYFEVPVDVIEDDELLADWAQSAIRVARAAVD